MSTNAQVKEAFKIAGWIDGLARAMLRLPKSESLLSTHDLAIVFRELALDIRRGEHRQKPDPRERP